MVSKPSLWADKSTVKANIFASSSFPREVDSRENAIALSAIKFSRKVWPKQDRRWCDSPSWSRRPLTPMTVITLSNTLSSWGSYLLWIHWVKLKHPRSLVNLYLMQIHALKSPYGAYGDLNYESLEYCCNVAETGFGLCLSDGFRQIKSACSFKLWILPWTKFVATSSELQKPFQ